MKKIISFGLIILISSSICAQVTELKEVELTAVSYKYLNAVDSEDNAIDVKILEEKVATYDVKSSEFYNDEYDIYYVSFYIPDGKILAAYDKDGNLIRTIEKFKNIKIPKLVRESIAKRFPYWAMTEHVYKVNFHEQSQVARKQYKVRLENGDKKMNVKLDENGNFM